MNYLLDKKTVFSNRPRPKTGGPFGYFFLILILILGGGILLNISSPVGGRVAQAIGLAATTFAWPEAKFQPFTRRAAIVSENEKLRREIKLLNLELISAQARIEALKTLEQELGQTGEINNSLVAGKIILKTGYFSFDNFFLDQGKTGSSTLIKPGQLVITGPNILLGEIIAVYSQTAKAKLYSAAGRKTAVRIGNKNIPALAEGLGGGNYLVNLPSASLVLHNDLVRTEKNGQEYILGVVGTVRKNEETPFQKIYIKPPVNIYELRYAAIIVR
ncbi:MAG: hypothetical protein A2571_02855 [Candidatus Vogelbacteria bacterium RIFOXYD1_FULL_44_32]|uniref:Cell shape-determining protein MreC n=1 Tax=Candidatus Vogelbacteria bacterium RIFOXYD1_FULL_44_32 TaxID=1802438 RepID=A0A1G2QDP8_9BACT|nr:MAG: hypothetical protein A2571_02855 [Candidatus Vogelbacteria bacterium RIFOXYD1_FULL_44_32]